ncbi:hypothetical protein [Mucilaginibacter ginkgonis]|uniref:Uncharacterized protein n=1 Tax=Mucilaginibacter ginkgonis TaxID=2682091 RepID=A0A6I4I7N7_9SPHI|nr:hypothetical protein [Mucilaginibacter ginkgonis]QQL49063.1 hypothetical protein GO620_012870 [Mucilaginibacter ginkgonis]
MSVEKILNADWSGIDKKKPIGDKGTITCEEVYEIDHLIEVFKEFYPGYNEKEIIYAIAASWRGMNGKQPRSRFVAAVASRLCGYYQLVN